MKARLRRDRRTARLAESPLWNLAMNGRVLLATLAAGSALTAATTATAAADSVTVPRGQPLQIAVVLDSAVFEPGIQNAIEMAVAEHPAIKGFPVQLNTFEAPCGGDDAVAANAAAAAAVVTNSQNVAVIGHSCSYAFAQTVPLDGGGCSTPSTTTALAIYESAGIVAINGSTTDPCLPSVGPTVFDSTAVPDPGFSAWYAQVKTLPSDMLWQLTYESEFGTPPTDFTDLYFDATSLLLTRLQQLSQLADGQLVIDRASLAQAVRHTSRFEGVTCTVELDPSTGFRIDDPTALARCTD
jgi:hypothetical protein